MPSVTFTSSGSWTAPADLAGTVQVQAWGEGGKGAVGSSCGGGGGGGAFAGEPALSGITPGVTTLTITIGTGLGTTNTTVTGGSVTVTAAHGGNASGNTAGAAGAAGSNTQAYAGGIGGAGTGSASEAAGGGSSAGTAAAGAAGASAAAGGTGGTAPTGGGTGGNGDVFDFEAGTAGSAPGGGGGGAISGNSPGGAVLDGAPGQVIITWQTGDGRGFPLVPPSPFTPMNYRHIPPPPGPVFGFAGKVALAPLAVAATELPPVFTGAPARAPLAVSGTFSAEYPFPATPLGIIVELLINGTWADVTAFVYARNDVVITRGRPDESQSVNPAQCTLTFRNTDGRFSPGNPAGAFYPYLGRNTQLRVSLDTWSAPHEVTGDTYQDTYSDTYGGSQDVLTRYTGYRFCGEISSLKPGWDKSGNDRWVDVVASGPLRRSSQAQGTIGSPMRRYYTRLTGDYMPYGYWPCEDASGSGALASAITGAAAMGFTGTPSLSSDSVFGGSDPVPSVNGSAWHGETLAASNPPGTGSLTEGTPGTFTWTCPPGVTSVAVTCTGAGGGGGAAGPFAGGGGGGGGGFASNASVPVTAGVTYTYVVPAGGAPGTTAGTQGTAGGNAVFTGDDGTVVTGGGGQPGIGGDTSTGGAGGTGGYQGGAGGTGQASVTTDGSMYLAGYTGATGTASGGTATQRSTTWAAPYGVTSASVLAGGGGGGGEGGGAFGEGYGGGGGGGGGLTSGVITTTPGSSYTFKAGDGGAGGNSGQAGQTGADSQVSGESSTSVLSHGGGGGSGAGGGGAGGGSTGSPGGSGYIAETGHGMGGGGGGGGGGGANGGGGNAPGPDTNPRQPGAGGGNGSGGGWGAESNGGTGGTGGGTGRAGSVQFSGGGGGGGGGAETNTTGFAGGGGGAGWIYWSWSYTGPAGGGGGSSAGPGSAGSAGTDGGTGGTAVTGGGAGGNDGLAGASPGGGGGGGIPISPVDTSVTPPGRGAPGQVTLSWSGGTVSPVAADIVRFVLDVQASGGTQASSSFTATNASPCVFTATGSAYTNGTPVAISGGSLPTGITAGNYYIVNASGDTFELAATSGGSPLGSSSTGSGNVQSTAPWVIARAITYGTVEQIDMIYYTGGALGLTGYDSAGSVLFSSGPVAFTVNGTPVMADIQLVADGADATWHINTIQPGGSQVGYSGTVSNVSVGYVSDVYISPDSDVTFASAGQVTVQSYAPAITSMAAIIAGYTGEHASVRLARLAAEENLTFTLEGNDTDTPQMGPQQDDTLVNVLQSCEDLDRGQLYEPRDSLGIAYRTRVSMQGQNPALTLDHSLAQLAGVLQPVADDQNTRNNITVTRDKGSNSTAALTSGPMSTAEPPDGVGDYTYSLTVYAYADTQLPALAAWMLTVGTVPDDRYPVITADLARPAVTGAFADIAAVDVGDYIQVINPPSWLTAAPISQLAWGMTEHLNAFTWTIDFNAVPESPYEEGDPPTW